MSVFMAFWSCSAQVIFTTMPCRGTEKEFWCLFCLRLCFKQNLESLHIGCTIFSSTAASCLDSKAPFRLLCPTSLATSVPERSLCLVCFAVTNGNDCLPSCFFWIFWTQMFYFNFCQKVFRGPSSAARLSGSWWHFLQCWSQSTLQPKQKSRTHTTQTTAITLCTAQGQSNSSDFPRDTSDNCM